MRRFLDWLDARTDYRRLVAPVRNRVLPQGPSWWLTSASCLLWLFVIEVITGLLMMASYSPSLSSAWASVYHLDQSGAGAMLRGLHHYTSHALILVLLIHVGRVLLTAAFRAPRELIWATGLLLIPLMLAWSVTGNPLSANQKGMAQIEVEGNILASTPLVGSLMRSILIGGDEPGNLTLTRLYSLHVGLFPLLALLLLGVHISQVYRHAVALPLVENGSSDEVPYWPYQSFRNAVVVAIVVGSLGFLAWSKGAPLDAPADPGLPQVPRPEWYFRWLFELRRYFTGNWEFVATMVVPLAVLGWFLSIPLIDRALSRRGSLIVRWLVVFGGVGIWSWLTWSSLSRDWVDTDYLAAMQESRELANRARWLAGRHAVPVAGAATLLRNDPQTQGPMLFARHCASCHSHANVQGEGIVAHEPSAPNLYGFGTVAWISGMLDPERIITPDYFGKTKFVHGDMAQKLRDMFDEAKDEAERKLLREQLALAAQALSAEAELPADAASDERAQEQIRAGMELIQGDLGCTDCHRFRDQGDLGTAPDLTGYGSRAWLTGMISNPQHEAFYAGDRNDRMPAFAPDAEDRSLLSTRELEMLVDWLRGDGDGDGRARKESDEVNASPDVVALPR